MKDENINIDIRLLEKDEVEEALEFQQGIFDGMPRKEWFYLVTRDEFLRVMEGRGKVGFLMDGDREMSIFSFSYGEDDLLEKYGLDNKNVMIVHGVMVKEEYRGRGLQRKMLKMAVGDAKKNEVDGVAATVHPDNIYSLRNFLSEGFEIMNKIKIYNGERYVVYLSIT